MIGALGNLDNYGLWITGVVGGLAAVGWLARRTYRSVRAFVRRTRSLARKIDALSELAQYELNHNGGGSLKDHAAKVPLLVLKVERIDKTLTEHLSTSEAAVLAGHKEGERMWSAIEALAKSNPPEEP